MADCAQDMFTTQAWIYDALMDWDQRLAREGPVFRKWCDELGALRVLDVACGSGRHAAMLHAWGLQVEAADVSDSMIALARSLWSEPPGLRWMVRGFEQPVESAGSFDLCYCIGNSLALAQDLSIMSRAVANMLAAVRPGGMVLIQVLNLQRLPDGPILWQKHKRLRTATDHLGNPGDLWISKGVHRWGDRGYVDVVVLDEAGHQVHGVSTPFAGVQASWLLETARDNGATEAAVYGDYAGTAYLAEQSVDLVLQARK